jgi:hypothetical protein
MRTQRDPNSRQSDPADHEWDRLKRLVESSTTSRRIGDDSITWEKATDPLDPPLLRIGRVAAMFHDEGYRILFRRQVSKPKAPNSVQMFPDPSPIAEKWWWLEPDVEDDFLWVVSETTAQGTILRSWPVMFRPEPTRLDGIRRSSQCFSTLATNQRKCPLT